jgi:chromosome segregation ATPase
MTRTELETASERLDSAADSAETNADRLADLADQLDQLAGADRGPDHGRLARIQTALDEIQQEVDDETAATIEDARTEVREYRATVDGV